MEAGMSLPLEDLKFQVSAPTPNADVLNAPSATVILTKILIFVS